MNTINGNFIEKSIPDTKNATIKVTIGRNESDMTVADFATATSSTNYKVYTALLNQTGGNAPVATVLQNTLGTISFTYIESGKYSVNSSGLFTLNKTMLMITSFGKFEGGIINTYRFLNTISDNTDSSLVIYVAGTMGGVNDILVNTPIEIRVYN